MFRVTVHDDAASLRFQIEGRLAGPWVQELHNCWQSTLTGDHSPAVCVDLTGATFVDDAGKSLLAQLHRAGATLMASGVLMRAVVEQVTQEAVAPEGIWRTKDGKGQDR